MRVRQIAVLVVFGCGVAALISLREALHGLDNGTHTAAGMPEIVAQSNTKDVLTKLEHFPTNLKALDGRLRKLEQSITDFVTTDAGAALAQTGAAQLVSDPAALRGAAFPDKSEADRAAAPSSKEFVVPPPPVATTIPPKPQLPVPVSTSSEEEKTPESSSTTAAAVKKKWREDNKCGKRSDSDATECNPDGEFPCCSSLGWCGYTAEHCECAACVDYRKKTSAGQNTVVSPGKKTETVVVIIPFRDREGHLVKFKEYWRWFAMEGRKPKTVRRWEIYIAEQFDSQTFNRGWTFNVGLAIVAAMKSASPDITSASKVNFDCAVIQDIDYLPEAGVDYSECEVPMQLSAEIDRYNWRTPYLESAGGIVSMNLAHWRKINGFGNNYFGWGGEDDELYHRVRINGLLYGDCHPFCKEGDSRIGRAGLSLKRPKKGFGRFSGKYMHSANHTKRITDSKAYDRNLKQLEEIKKGSPRWKTDGLSNLAFRVVQTTVDKADSETYGITYHHVKAHRGADAFSLGNIPFAVPTSMCSFPDADEPWKIEEMGPEIPWDVSSLRARTSKSAKKCEGVARASFILLDRRRNLAKVIPDENNPRQLIVFYRSLHRPAEDGLIIVHPLSAEKVREAFVAVGAFAAPPADYSVCTAKARGGLKFSLHESLACGGGGWESMKGGHIQAYTTPHAGTKAVSWCDNEKFWTQRFVASDVCPEKWAGLKWEHGGTFWVPEGEEFCVGTRESNNQEDAFSRILPKGKCGGEGFNHMFSFKSVSDDDMSTTSSRLPPAPLVVCVGVKEFRIHVVADPPSCDALPSALLKISARVPSSTDGASDRLLCAVRDNSGSHDMFLEGSECTSEPNVKFQFVVPRLSPTPVETPSSSGTRSRVCIGRSALTPENIQNQCSGIGFFEAASLLDVVSSTPLDVNMQSAGAPYVLVEEAIPCFGFLCPGTLARKS